MQLEMRFATVKTTCSSYSFIFKRLLPVLKKYAAISLDLIELSLCIIGITLILKSDANVISSRKSSRFIRNHCRSQRSLYSRCNDSSYICHRFLVFHA